LLTRSVSSDTDRIRALKNTKNGLGLILRIILTGH